MIGWLPLLILILPFIRKCHGPQTDIVSQFENRRSSLVINDAFFGSWSPDGSEVAFIRTTWRSADGWPSISDVFLLDVHDKMERRSTGI